MNLLKNAYTIAAKVYEHITPKAAEVYSDSEFYIYFKQNEGYAIGDAVGNYIDYCGPNWAYVSECLEQYAE